MERARLVVLDPGFRATHGHHFILNDMIAGECRRRDMGLELCAAQDASKAVLDHFAARPVFRHGPYTNFSRQSDYDILRTISIASVAFEQDLNAAGLRLTPGDRLLVHTLTLRQLFGLYGWFSQLPAPRPPLAVVFRFPPWYFVEAYERELAMDLQAYAFQLWRKLPAGEVAFGADSRELVELMSKSWQAPVAECPIPLAPPELSPETRPAPAQGGLHIVYAGEARPDKGFHLLSGALARGLARHPGLRFTIQSVNSGAKQQAWLKEQFAAVAARTTFAFRALGQVDYHRLIRSADAVLVAYDPRQYTYRTSHVFVDALAQGKPVVYTARSWMDGEARILSAAGGPIGPRMTDFTEDALVEALDELVARYDSYAAAAAAAAPGWRARHNIGAFFDALARLWGDGDGRA
ncbi:MAG: glycosyltransferase family 4 protein [Alphaproteobacteria bacterium]|nr:glycosyltransferase family 4 protein [Alphaproteobacteria bacterium]